MLYGEYQFQKRFEQAKLVTTAGVVGTRIISNAELFQDTTRYATNIAGYLQVDKKFFDRLNISLGARYEYNKVEDVSEAKPVFRAGLNYEVAKYTFLRVSWGQGYRFPTIAEKYVRTDLGEYVVGGIPIELGIFPNINLKSETGWSAELGIKQGLQLGDWRGFIDVTGFINQYNDMMEFTFGINNSVRSVVNLIGPNALDPDLYTFLVDTSALKADVQIPNDNALRAGFNRSILAIHAFWGLILYWQVRANWVACPPLLCWAIRISNHNSKISTMCNKPSRQALIIYSNTDSAIL
ncbi:MAG: TonB-dependent receptor [Sphingobacteriales bacterium]|nr:TonB-dependent receptor [Sphingobacteriales bacterium]